MNAGPYLEKIAGCFHDVGLDAVMIGNAAAAINGAPVTTMDVDFMLEDVIASKRAAAREKDLAALPVLEMTLDEIRKQKRA